MIYVGVSSIKSVSIIHNHFRTRTSHNFGPVSKSNKYVKIRDIITINHMSYQDLEILGASTRPGSSIFFLSNSTIFNLFQSKINIAYQMLAFIKTGFCTVSTLAYYYYYHHYYWEQGLFIKTFRAEALNGQSQQDH